MKNEKILIDKLKDLDQQSDDVKGISAKIDELRAKGYAMLDQVPAHKRTCAIKVKHRVNVIMERATEETDQCIASNVDSPPNHDLNVRHTETISHKSNLILFQFSVKSKRLSFRGVA